MINVLVTSAGTASAINVIKALRLQQEFEVNIHAVDIDVTAPGLYLADKFKLVPRSNMPEFLPALIEYCSRENISVLFPIHSSELQFFASNSTRFTEKGIKMLIPPLEAINLCNDKNTMGDFIRKIGIHTPNILNLFNADLEFPLIAKPNNKSGSQDLFKIIDDIDLNFARVKFGDHLIQEWIEGTEVTVDCLYDKNSNLVVASPRKRLVTKAGQCVKGITFRDDQIASLCEKIGNAIQFTGPANLQFIIKDGIPYFIEMNPRFAAGGLMLTVHAGANIPQMILEILVKGNVAKPEKITEGLLMLRYYEEIYINNPF